MQLWLDRYSHNCMINGRELRGGLGEGWGES
jgi:hypothetical protein